jgi:hypothetical protein
MVTITKSQNGNIRCWTCRKVIGNTHEHLWEHLDIVHLWSRISPIGKRNSNHKVDS